AGAARRGARRAGAASGGLLRVGEFGRVAGNELVLFRAGNDLERDSLVAGDQEPGAGRAGEQVTPLTGGEVETLADLGDRLRRLPQEQLGGGVGDDRLPEFAAEQVRRVLGDRGQPTPALARALGQ